MFQAYQRAVSHFALYEAMGRASGGLARDLAIAAAAIALVLGAAGASIDAGLSQQLLEREAAVSQEYLESIVQSEGISAASLSDTGRTAELAAFARLVASRKRTLRATIYAPDGFIRHSTEPNLIGIRFHDNEELEVALEGRLVVKLESREDKSEQIGLSRLAGEQLIEAYVPVRGADGRMIAVVEYYTAPDAVLAAVAAERIRLAGHLALAALLLFGGFAWARARM